MENIRLVLLKILLIVALITILSVSVADAKKNKKHSSLHSKVDIHGHETQHKKIKRSAYGNWAKSGGYGMPPYLVYNRKLGAYYPYFKYPENRLRRNLQKMFRQYTADKKYSTLPQTWTNRMTSRSFQ